MSIGCNPIVSTITGSGSYIVPNGFEAYVLLAESSDDLVVNGSTIIKGASGGITGNLTCGSQCNENGQTITKVASSSITGIVSGSYRTYLFVKNPSNGWCPNPYNVPCMQAASVKLKVNSNIISSWGMVLYNYYTGGSSYLTNFSANIYSGDSFSIESFGALPVTPTSYWRLGSYVTGSFSISESLSKPSLGNVFLNEGDTIFGGIYTLNLYQKS